MEQNKKPEKVSDLLTTCPLCGIKPELLEETFYGSSVPKFRVTCPKCGRTTAHHAWAKAVIGAWNKGHIKVKRERNLDMDNDGLITLMSEVVGQAARDYHWYATKPKQTGIDKQSMRKIEDFILENPYALPYDGQFVMEKLRKLAEKTRKKQVS